MRLMIMLGKIVDFWEAAQVELHGCYSVARVRELSDYNHRTSTFRALLVMLLMPWLSVLLTIIVALIPLREPSEGLQANYLFFLMTFVAVGIVGGVLCLQFRHTVPTAPLSNGRVIRNSIFASVLTTGLTYLVCSGVGFPLPFSFVIMSPAFLVFLLAPIFPWMRRVRNEPEVWHRVINTFTLWNAEHSLMFIYPVFFYIFTTLPPKSKTPFTFLLPIMKILLRNVVSRTVVHMNDEIPEIVLMNVEVFNSLFMSYCMQNTPSIWTTLGLIAIDGAQMMAAMNDIGSVIRHLQVVKERVNAEHERQLQRETIDAAPRIDWRVNTVLGYTRDILERYTAASSSQITLNATSGVSSHRVAPAGPAMTLMQNKVSPNHVLSAQSASERSKQAPRSGLKKVFPARKNESEAGIGKLELEYALQVRKVLYIAEFILLINYIEVIVPIIFSTNLVVMYYLPNREYFSHVVNMNDEKLWKTLGNVMLYCFLQLVSLVILFIVLWRKVRISGLRQLAFVLENQAEQVQVKLVLWVFCNTQALLLHNGFDYSFTFAWLKETPS